MKNTLVSVIVPSYKRNKQMVKRAIDSLLAQTYPHLEIILVDDNAAAENSDFRACLEALVAEYDSDKIVYIQNQQNLGGSDSRNVGINNAKGEFVTFLDDDDRYLKHKVERQLNFMLKNSLDMCFTNLVIINGNNEVVDYREYSKLKSFDNESLLKYHLTRQIAGTDSFMYKKQTLLDIGGFVKVPMGQEYYLMYNTIKSGAKIGYLNTNDALLYREGQECISSSANKVSGQKTLYQFKKDNFDALSLRERVYVRFRHHAVLAVAYKRLKKPFKCLLEIIVGSLCSPLDALRELFSFFMKRHKVVLEEE